MKKEEFEKYRWKTAPNDIYDNETRYGKIRNNLETLLSPELENGRKYWVKNSNNLEYLRTLLAKLEAKGTSYINRLKLLNVFKVLAFHTEKDIKDLTREDIDRIIAEIRIERTSKGQSDFVKNLKTIAKIIIPEKDEKGRMDETITPYIVRHLSSKIDKSREERKEQVSPEEVARLINYYGTTDKRMRAFISLLYESFARPQELLYIKNKDVEIHEKYAKVYVNNHGKEGTKFLQCIDSYQYLIEWMNLHPKKDDKEAFLFCMMRGKDKFTQLSIEAVNKSLRVAKNSLNIEKQVSGYSFKRAGITHARILGESDADIQHKAGWTSTAQLKTYDYSKHEETFKIQLIKKGIVNPSDIKEELKRHMPTSKTCVWCGTNNGIAETFCHSCKRGLDKTDIIKKDEEEKAKINVLSQENTQLKLALEELRKDVSNLYLLQTNKLLAIKRAEERGIKVTNEEHAKLLADLELSRE